MPNLTELLQDLTLEEILEHCNITEEEVLQILIDGGHVELPPFLEYLKQEEEQIDD